ncbi:hypothetical protein B0H14DRAFT_3534547 [Mycena olivaceomarginata]|nr:hypothetical protein B0H14DRAFT_3534547 [Mycena olivaceomarginata]
MGLKIVSACRHRTSNANDITRAATVDPAGQPKSQHWHVEWYNKNQPTAEAKFYCRMYGRTG